MVRNSLASYAGEGREGRPERWLPSSAEAVGLLSGKPGASYWVSQPRGEPPPRNRECYSPLLYLILTRALAQAITPEGCEDFLQLLGPENNMPREPLLVGCGLSADLLSACKRAAGFGKVRMHFQKSALMCILGTENNSLRLPRFEQSCQSVANDPQMWYFYWSHHSWIIYFLCG